MEARNVDMVMDQFLFCCSIFWTYWIQYLLGCVGDCCFWNYSSPLPHSSIDRYWITCNFISSKSYLIRSIWECTFGHYHVSWEIDSELGRRSPCKHWRRLNHEIIFMLIFCVKTFFLWEEYINKVLDLNLVHPFSYLVQAILTIYLRL